MRLTSGLALGCAAVLSALAGAEERTAARKGLEHWAWTPPERHAPPPVKDEAWVRNPLDRFILARLEAEAMAPASPAAPEELIRRASLDLTGLPPTPEEIDAFLADASPGAFERVVDRLLASPRHGERWARHWLDLARYADSNGFEHDEPRPEAWRYRDYVIASLNSDKPYDRFIQEQLAGDELFPEDLQALVATGFNLLGPDMTDAADQAVRRLHTLNDMTDTASLVFLGLTVGCARCHDHKFEPIPQTDYYRLQAFFAPASFRNDVPIAAPAARAAHTEAEKRYASLVKPFLEDIARLEEPHRLRLRETKLSRLAEEAQTAHRKPASSRTPAERELVEKTTRLIQVTAEEMKRALDPAELARREALEKEVRRFDRDRPAPLPVALGLRDASGAPPRTFLLERGEPGNQGQEVEPGFPAVLTHGNRPAPAPVEPPGPQTTGRRAALARWLATPRNPLTARVAVNRLWAHHFGKGLVATPSDFGVRGEPPSHPELLDWLACELVESGWSLKAMHRLMVTSAAYRQSSRAARESVRKDPANRLLGRFARRRLEAETVRDSLLFSSGLLDLTAGGPGGPAEGPEAQARRSIYLFQRRNLRPAFLEAFDLPDTNLSCPQRDRTITAPQALALLNAPDAARAARALAARLEREAPSEETRVEKVYRITLGRRPSRQEAAWSREFLRESPLSELCRALFNLNEFVMLE